MGALVIWGEDDHANRAKALATTYNTTAQKIDVKPKKVADLDTLVFWGHGDTAKFCGLAAGDFIDLVSAWKKANSGLATIEMLTCNARHKQGGHADAYTEQVVTKLTRKHATISFRALPVATAKGGVCQFSILKWHPATTTWAYVGATGVDDKMMWAAATKVEDFMPPRGTNDGYPRAHAAMRALPAMTTTHAYAVKRKWAQKEVDDYNKVLKDVRQEAFIIAGTLGMLRWALTDIK